MVGSRADSGIKTGLELFRASYSPENGVERQADIPLFPCSDDKKEEALKYLEYPIKDLKASDLGALCFDSEEAMIGGAVRFKN